MMLTLLARRLACALPCATVLVVVVVVGNASACAECQTLLDCPFNEVCSRDGVCVPEPGPRELPPCEVTEDSPLFDNEQGLLDGDTIWQCPTDIVASGGNGPRFTGVEGTRITVTGSLFDLSFPHEGEFPPGSILVYGVEEKRYFARTLDGPLENPLRAQLFVRPFANGGDYEFFIGVDPGAGTQDAVRPTSLFKTELRVLGVGSGDIQVNLSWDTTADVDLHVFSPAGEHVFYGESEVPSGGNLDLDSNVGCGSSSDERNENVVWPTGSAIPGEYRIHANLFFEDCGFAETNYRVVVIRDLEVVEIVDGTLLASEIDINDGAGELVTTVTWPP